VTFNLICAIYRMFPRLDFIFSYWTFAWFIAFIIGIVPYNPKWFLVAGVIENVLLLVFTNVKHPLLFLLVNFFIKVLPLIAVWNTPTYSRDITAGLVLFIMYIAWMGLNNESIFKVRTPVTDYIYTKSLRSTTI